MVEKLRILRLKFQAGSTANAPPLDVETPNVTVLVGPNNSGKSETLRELEAWCQGKNPAFKVLDAVAVALPDSFDEMMSMLEPHKTAPPPNQESQPDHFWIARPAVRQGENEIHQQVNEGFLKNWFEQRSTEHGFRPIAQVFIKLFTLRLDGRSRFDLVEPKETGPLEGRPRNHLWALFKNDEGRLRVRKFTEEAFGKYFVIDPTGMTSFRVRLADRKPKSASEEQALDARARAFHLASPLVSSLGDGVRASVGLVAAIMSVSHRILLVDEPEAFLHPTLARRVGRVLAEIARERVASLIVATHSSDFLVGCMQAAPELRIVRLTYVDGVSSARSIQPEMVASLMNDPLLRSANALRSLFHRGVVVAEADADRAFYEEVNHRLNQIGQGIDDALFMNAQNWQTIPRVVAPLRRLGIPAAAVFDFDVIMDKDFSHIWPLLNADLKDREHLEKLRLKVRPPMEEAGRKLVKEKGIDALHSADASAARTLLCEFAQYGIFFVPVGELEGWLAATGVPRSAKQKSNWLTSIFTKMGSDPTNDAYMHPGGDDDVWGFITRIEEWISAPTRAGIPA